MVICETTQERTMLIKVEDGIAHISVATKRHPNAVTFIDERDIPVVLDGGPHWLGTQGDRARRGAHIGSSPTRHSIAASLGLPFPTLRKTTLRSSLNLLIGPSKRWVWWTFGQIGSQ